MKHSKYSPRRLFLLLGARLRCHWWLMFHMEHRELLVYHEYDGRLFFVAACKGSLINGNLEIPKLFWNEEDTP